MEQSYLFKNICKNKKFGYYLFIIFYINILINKFFQSILYKNFKIKSSKCF